VSVFADEVAKLPIFAQLPSYRRWTSKLLEILRGKSVRTIHFQGQGGEEHIPILLQELESSGQLYPWRTFPVCGGAELLEQTKNGDPIEEILYVLSAEECDDIAEVIDKIQTSQKCGDRWRAVILCSEVEWPRFNIALDPFPSVVWPRIEPSEAETVVLDLLSTLREDYLGEFRCAEKQLLCGYIAELLCESIQITLTRWRLIASQLDEGIPAPTVIKNLFADVSPEFCASVPISSSTQEHSRSNAGGQQQRDFVARLRACPPVNYVINGCES
jgi:hypothetical protein